MNSRCCWPPIGLLYGEETARSPLLQHMRLAGRTCRWAALPTADSPEHWHLMHTGTISNRLSLLLLHHGCCALAFSAPLYHMFSTLGEVSRPSEPRDCACYLLQANWYGSEAVPTFILYIK